MFMIPFRFCYWAMHVIHACFVMRTNALEELLSSYISCLLGLKLCEIHFTHLKGIFIIASNPILASTTGKHLMDDFHLHSFSYSTFPKITVIGEFELFLPTRNMSLFRLVHNPQSSWNRRVNPMFTNTDSFSMVCEILRWYPWDHHTCHRNTDC